MALFRKKNDAPEGSMFTSLLFKQGVRYVRIKSEESKLMFLPAVHRDSKTQALVLAPDTIDGEATYLTYIDVIDNWGIDSCPVTALLPARDEYDWPMSPFLKFWHFIDQLG